MQEDAKTRQSRVYELEDLSTTRWADHDTKNALLRRNFRKEKRQRISRQLSDAALRERIGWSSDRILASEHSDQPGYTTPDIKQQWNDARNAQALERTKDIRLRSRSERGMHNLSPAARRLAGRLLTHKVRR